MWDIHVSLSPVEESIEKAHPNLPTRDGATGTSHSEIRIPCKKIMLTYDGSLLSEEAFQVARTIAQEFNAKLLILGVAPLPADPNISELQNRIEDARQRFSRRLYKIRLDGMNDGLQIETTVALGDACELTRRIAERFHAHLIVIGHESHKAGLSMSGSTQEVTIVRFGASARAVLRREGIRLSKPTGTNREIE